MNIKYLTLASITACMILTACSKETYTVDYLKENETVRNEVLEACKNNKQTDENCKNANEAKDIVYMEEIRKKQNR